jgi:hypothetical protein
MILKNYHNAFSHVVVDGISIVVDPWIKEGIYNNSWVPTPGADNQEIRGVLMTADMCIITHIHEDHFDLDALRLLKKDCTIVLPNMWPNNIVASKKMPDKNIKFANLSETVSLCGIQVTFIPPMNGEGHLVDLESKCKSDELVVDTGVILKYKSNSITLLADNFPWDLSAIPQSVKEMIIKSDLIGVPFNSFADDYPVCFDNLEMNKKLEISTKRNYRRLEYLVKFLNETNTKNIFPYSSDFLIQGKRAKVFNECHPDEFKCRKAFSKLLSLKTKCNIIPLSSNQEVKLFNKNIEVAGQFMKIDFASLCESMYKEEDNIQYDKVPVSLVDDKLKKASRKMFSKMSNLEMKTDWILKFEIIDHVDTCFVVDPKQKMTFLENTNKEKIKSNFLLCKIRSGHLFNILDFKTHWDNERISYNLSWERSIDKYDKNINKVINFLHT